MENFYFILLLIPIILLCYWADKKNKKSLLFLAIVLLSLIVGLRGTNVGIDTKDYYYAFNNNFPRSWQFQELGFRYLSMLFMTLFHNATIVMLIYAFIINVFMMLRLWDFREKCNFPIMIFLYLFIYLFSTMNIMRQFITISVIFYSSRFLEKKKYFLFFIIVFLMSLIHKSSLLALLLIIVYMWNTLSSRKKFLFLFPIIIVSLIGLLFVLWYESDHINNYFSVINSVNNLNITFIYRFVVCLFSYFLFKSKIKLVYKKNLFKTKSSQIITQNSDFKIIFILYFIGLCFSSVGMFFNNMERFGYFYLCFELVYWGYLTKSSKNNFLNFSMISIYAVYVFMLELIANGSGIFPYYLNF